MVTSDTIRAGGEVIKSADSWGVTSLSIFFTILIVGLVIFFMWFIVRELKRSVDGNTEAIKDNGELSKEMLKTMHLQNNTCQQSIKTTEKISKTQDEIKADIKELLYGKRYKHGINDYDLKGDNNDE